MPRAARRVGRERSDRSGAYCAHRMGERSDGVFFWGSEVRLEACPRRTTAVNSGDSGAVVEAGGRRGEAVKA